MKFLSTGLVSLLAVVALALPDIADARQPPVAKLVQVEGDVEYSRNGDDWRPVRRTKYLFPGYQIRSGSNGGGKLINQRTGLSQELGRNTVVEVEEDSISVLDGSLSKPEEESVSIWESLANKFAKAQRYTTVRRSVTDPSDDNSCDNKVYTIRRVALSPTHPDLVWRNACPEYSYRLVIGDEAFDIPAQSTAEMIRYEVTGLEPGEYEYHVEVLDKDGTVYIPRRPSTLVWYSSKQEREILSRLDEFDGDLLLTTTVLEENDMYVAAMDEYRGYFQDYPNDNELRPLLIESYQTLKLSDLRENEARLYNASLDSDF